MILYVYTCRYMYIYIYVYIHDMLCVYMTLRPGVKDYINPNFCSILGLRSSCPPLCHTCGNKWSVVGGGLCAICRSLDRLVPAAAEQEVLTFLRGWICSLQDLGELFRGAPNHGGGDLCLRGSVPETPPLPGGNNSESCACATTSWTGASSGEDCG